MTDYTITTNFGAKDSLPSGNAGKVIKGEEFTTEFTNIQTAVNTKADTAGDTFTGVVNFSDDVAVNTNTLFVDVSEAKVGIGTTSPTEKLSVAVASNSGSTLFYGGTQSDRGLKITAGNEGGFDNSAWTLNASADNAGSMLAFKTRNAERMRIDGSGNVGIGTDSPTQKLQVDGNIRIGDTAVGVDDDEDYNITTGGQLTIHANDSGENENYVSLNLSCGNPSGSQAAYSRISCIVNDDEKMRIDSSGNVGIGETNPADKFQVTGGAVRIKSDFPRIYLEDTNNNSDYSIINDNGKFSIFDDTNSLYRFALDASGNVGIGTHNPSAKLHIDNGATSEIITQVFGGGSIYSGVGVDGTGAILTAGSSGSANASMIFRTASNGAEAERMRIDASGNVLVGKTSGDNATAGLELNANGQLVGTFADGTHVLGRNSSDGNILAFIKDGSTVGAIASISGQYLSIGTGDTGLAFDDDENHIIPWNINTNGSTNGAVDLGDSARRFKDIYRSGSTYSISDRNKKQDIRDLTDAEARVATVAKGSLKAFRYIDAVEAGGDDANIHFGIIAQDLKAAFEAEGLNADNYQVLKTSTYTDDDGVEQTTYSVCYENLLAFIISAI